MPQSPTLGPLASAQVEAKPCPVSYDSSREFSLEHFLEVRRLVALAELEDRELKGYVFDDSLLDPEPLHPAAVCS